MDLIARALAVYLVLMLLFRITGKRSLAQVSTFDFVLLLVVGEATQQALLGDDFSITTAAIVIATLLVVDRGADYLGYTFPKLGRAMESVPLILMNDGELLRERMRRVQITEEDILASARERHGIERLDQVKYAVLEQSGGISVIPKQT